MPMTAAERCTGAVWHAIGRRVGSPTIGRVSWARLGRVLCDDGPLGRSLAAVVLAVAWVATWRPQVDPDAWWHLAIGESIVNTASIPALEPFSWLTAGDRLVAHSWLWDVLLASAWRVGDLTGTSLLVLPVMAFIVWLVWQLISMGRVAAAADRSAGARRSCRRGGDAPEPVRAAYARPSIRPGGRQRFLAGHRGMGVTRLRGDRAVAVSRADRRARTRRDLAPGSITRLPALSGWRPTLAPGVPGIVSGLGSRKGAINASGRAPRLALSPPRRASRSTRRDPIETPTDCLRSRSPRAPTRAIPAPFLWREPATKTRPR